jgi:hypothetical protein
MSVLKQTPAAATVVTTAAKLVKESSAKPTPKTVANKEKKATPTKPQRAIRAKTAAKDQQPLKAAKVPKEKKVKMILDSFTIPKPEYDVLNVLKLRAAKLETPVKKTEIVRAGIKALAALSDSAFVSAMRAVPNLKTGRPTKPA